MNIERDVIKNSEYIITYYQEKEKKLTNLEIQKLAYFLEAIYMVCTNEDYLYNEEFLAWNFGPVNTTIYNEYKIFGRMPIELKRKVIINPINLKYIEILYNLFSEFTPTELVNLSHANNSPWDEIYRASNGNIPKNMHIDKIKTKNWFGTLVEKKDE